MFRKRMSFRMMPLLIVFLAIMINILGAIILKTLAMCSRLSMCHLVSGVLLVILLNGFRLVIWGIAHSRYPLSMTYPFSSLFFPLLLLVSYFYGDSIGWNKCLGTGLITVGVFLLALKNDQE